MTASLLLDREHLGVDMAIHAVDDRTPGIDLEAYVHPDAVMIGAVTVAAGSSVWPGAVLRGVPATSASGPNRTFRMERQSTAPQSIPRSLAR